MVLGTTSIVSVVPVIVCFATILSALKIARFPAVTAVPSRLSLHPRAPRISPGRTPARYTYIYKDRGTRTFSRRRWLGLGSPIVPVVQPSQSILGITIKDDEPRCGTKWKRFSQLLDNPQACRMLCDIEMQDAPTIVTDDEKAIEHAEGDRRNSEEVHRGNRFPVITEKGKPALRRLRISRCPFHPTRDRSLRDIKTEHEKLAMDAWRSPRWVLNDHPENQFLNFHRRLSSPNGPPDLGDQLPVQTESAPVPTHHGFGRDRNEGLLPSGPEATNGDPEELVEQV